MQVDSQEMFIRGLHEFKPDVILSDHSLPQFNSMEALKICRAQGLTIPFILVTGTMSEEFAVNCLKLGVDDYVLKSNLKRLPAAILNALKVVKKKLPEARIVFTGAGASGIATAKLLMKAGAKHIIGCDRAGAIYKGRKENMNSMKEWFAEHTNPRRVQGTAGDALEGADIFIGLSGPGVVSLKDIKTMNKDSIVFAMANPIPEILPEEAGAFVKVMATGRSDYPNQINNSCCFPGFFRGMLDVRARRVNDEMKLAAAHAIANIVGKSELSEDYITPTMFDARLVPAVSSAVAEAAVRTGVARKKRVAAR